MEETLNKLKIIYQDVTLNCKEQQNKLYLLTLKFTSLFRENISEKVPTVFEVVFEDISFLSIYVLSPLNNSTFDKIAVYNRSETSEIIDPQIKWDSGAAGLNFGKLNYLNAIHYITNEIIDYNSDLYKLYTTYISLLKNEISIYNKLKIEKGNIETEIRTIEKKIRFEKFMSFLKENNYYCVEEGNSHFQLYKVIKISCKTVILNVYRTSGNIDIFDKLDNGECFIKRFSMETAFGTLENSHIVNRETFLPFVRDKKIMKGIERMYYGTKVINMFNDIKDLCTYLFENRIINERVPDNETLQSISRLRYEYLKNKKN